MKVKHDEASFFGTEAKEKYAYKDYKPLVKKDLLRVENFLKDQAMLPPEQQTSSIDFFASSSYNFTDKEDFPLLILGTISGSFLKTVKDLIKANKKHNAMGTCKTTKDAKGNTQLELSIEMGSIRPKLFKKLAEKWLIPDGMSITFAGGILEMDEELDVPIAPAVSDSKTATAQIPANPKILAAYELLKTGDLDNDLSKKRQLHNQINNFLDNFLAQYPGLAPQQKEALKETYAKYVEINNFVDAIVFPDPAAKASDGIEPVMTVDELKMLGGGTSWGFGKTTYDEILDVLGVFYKTADAKARVVLLKRIEALVAKWETAHPVAKRDKSDKQRGEALKTLLANLQPYTSGKVLVLDKQADKNTLNKGTAISDAKAGTSKASERARQIAEASADDRAIELANLLQRGKAANDDKTFGAVMKWLADNGSKFEDKYLEATVQLFNKPSSLPVDLAMVFKQGSLRHTYLLNQQADKQSIYAPVAMALGVLGNGWFNTEIGDAFLYMNKNLKADEIAVLSDYNKAKGIDVFAEAVSKKILSDKAFAAEMQGLSLLKGQREKQDVSATIGDLNKKEKKSYVSADDYFLCATYNRLDTVTGIDLAKFTDAVKKWVAQTTPEERSKILAANSEFSKLIAAKVGKFVGGLSKSQGAQIRSIIEYFTEPAQGQESIKVIDQMNQLAEEQAKKNVYTRWKQKEQMGKKFKDILFNDKQVKSPQQTIVQKFCHPVDVAAWATASEDERIAILDKAKAELNKIMTKANVDTDEAAEIMDMIDSDGARGNTYNKIRKEIAGAKTNIGAADDFMKAINALPADSKEIVGIKDDLELLRAIKTKALDGIFKTDSDRKKWTLAMVRLGLPPSQKEIDEAKAAWDADSTNVELQDKYEILLELQDIADPKKLPATNKSKAPADPSRASRSRKKIISQEQIEEQKDQQKTVKKTAAYWAANMAAEYKKGFTGRDDHKLLLIAYDSNKAKIDGGEILKEILHFSPSLHKAISSASAKDWDWGKSAYMIKCVLDGSKVPSVVELLQHAKNDALFQRRVRMDDLNVLTENASESQLLTDWFDVEGLKENLAAKKALIAEAESISNKADKTEADTDRLDEIEREMAAVNARVNQFDIKPDILKQLDGTASADKILKLKKQIREKLAGALTDSGKADALLKALEKAGITDITASDLQLLGTTVKGIATLEHESSLETGTQWTSMSSRMLQRDMEAAKFLKEGWKGKEKLQQVGKLSKEEQEAETKKFADKMKDANENLAAAQERFVEMKAKYDGNLKKIVSIFVNSILFAITSLSGVGGAGMLLQMVFGSASTAITTVVNQVLEKITKGENYGGAEAFWANFFAEQTSYMVGFWVGQALKVVDLPTTFDALEKSVVGEDKVKMLFTTPLKDAITGIPKGIAGSITKSVVNQVFNEKGSITGKTIAGLETYIKNLITGLPFSYLKGVMVNSSTLIKEKAIVLFGGNVADFKYDAKYGMTKVKKSALKNFGKPEDFFNDLADNLKNPKVMCNLMNGLLDGPININLKSFVSDYADDAIAAIKAEYPKIALDKIDKGAIKTQLLRSAEEAAEKLRKEVLADYDKLPEETKASVSKEDIEKMDLKKLTELHNDIPKKMTLEEIKLMLSKVVKMSDKGWEAFDARYAAGVNESLTINTCLESINRNKVAFEDEKFADDLISNRVKQPYMVFEAGAMKPYQLDLGINTIDVYEDWKIIQQMIADGEQTKAALAAL